MSNNLGDYGLLLTPDIKLHRQYFKQMTELLGVNCTYRAPKKGADFDMHGDLEAYYEPPIKVGCIFQDHPDQKTLKKMGWVAELQESSSIIHVPYDLPGLEVGALFSVPSGLDHAEGRLFRVVSMQNSMVYPASIACEIAPEYEDATPKSETGDFQTRNFSKLLDLEGED